MSSSTNGRRNALCPSREMIWVAQAVSSEGSVGRQVKMARRLAVSDTPVGLKGPPMTRSRRCGSASSP